MINRVQHRPPRTKRESSDEKNELGGGGSTTTTGLNDEKEQRALRMKNKDNVGRLIISLLFDWWRFKQLSVITPANTEAAIFYKCTPR